MAEPSLRELLAVAMEGAYLAGRRTLAHFQTGVLVGVEVRGEPAAGVIYLPALDEMVAAADGLGCTWNGRPCRVSSVVRIEDALLVVTSVTSCQARSDAYDRLV